MSELLELAARVEAIGADRELDGAIDRLLNERPKNGDYDAAERAFWRVDNGYSGLLVRPDGFARASFCALEYTTSIDAAMTLVPPAPATFNVRLESDDDVWGAAVMHPADRGADVRWCATPALALCSAALRARAHEGLGEG